MLAAYCLPFHRVLSTTLLHTAHCPPLGCLVHTVYHSTAYSLPLCCLLHTVHYLLSAERRVSDGSYAGYAEAKGEDEWGQARSWFRCIHEGAGNRGEEWQRQLRTCFTPSGASGHSQAFTLLCPAFAFKPVILNAYTRWSKDAASTITGQQSTAQHGLA